MGTHRHILKTLRNIALEHASSVHPDLASMARELGRVVHQDASSMATRLASLRKRQRGFERVLLARRSKPPLSAWIVAWPPNHVSPLREHAGAWGLEIALVGALEVQSCRREAASNELTSLERQWLGPGDGSWFDGEIGQLRRCRNLSRYETALSLHVYGDEMTDYATPVQTDPAGQLIVTPRHGITASHMHG